MKIYVFTSIVLPFMLISRNLQGQFAIENERLIAKSNYYADDNNEFKPSDSTTFFYCCNNNLVNDPYKTYLARPFDSIESFILSPYHEYIISKYMLSGGLLNFQYRGEMLKNDSSAHYWNVFEGILLAYKAYKIWDGENLLQQNEIECLDTDCTDQNSELTVYEYNEEGKITRRLFLFYNTTTESYDTSSIVYNYAYSNGLLSNYEATDISPQHYDTYISEQYYYTPDKKLEKLNSYEIYYFGGSIIDSTHKSFTYSEGQLVNYREEIMADGLFWEESTNISFTYSDNKLTAITGVFSFDTLNIMYYLNTEGQYDSIIKYELPEPYDKIEKEFFYYNLNGTLKSYSYTGNHNTYPADVNYQYDEFNRMTQLKTTYKLVNMPEYNTVYNFSYSPHGNFSSLQYLTDYDRTELENIWMEKYYYEPIKNEPLGNATNSITIHVFPSPANNILNIDVFGITENTSLAINIRNSMGSMVMSFKKDLDVNSTFTLDISKLASGIYIVEVNDGKNSSIQKVVIY